MNGDAEKVLLTLQTGWKDNSTNRSSAVLLRSA
jgi:hypothetical protein